MSTLTAARQTVRSIQPLKLIGRVAALRGLTLLVHDLPMPVGSLVRVQRESAPAGKGDSDGLGEVVGFDGAQAVVMMLCSSSGIRPGDRVTGLQTTQTVPVGRCMLGRVINGLGKPIDGGGAMIGLRPQALEPQPIGPLERSGIHEPMYTGVRAVDLFTTLGRGQRLGVFAGPGVGKSTLLGAIARNSAADISVVALIGERGREVRDFIEKNLGEAGLRRSIVVVATGDESPLLRVRAAHVACAVAEFFRDQGQSVMLIMDSVTRFAHAQRQIGLSIGEPPAMRGYTPSVFAGLARLLERAGSVTHHRGSDSDAGSSQATTGSITGLYSVLVEGDDMTEPIADAARGILDGHLILSRALAQRAHYPAIDILDSVSRVADDVTDPQHQSARRQMVRLLAAYRRVEDLIQVGAYAHGSNPESDTAIRYHSTIASILQQNLTEPLGASDTPAAFAVWRTQMLKVAMEAASAQSAASAAGAGARTSARRS